MMKEKGVILKSGIDSWFEDCQKRLKVDIKKIPLAESKDWILTYTKDGKPNEIVHCTHRIHQITCLQAWDPARNQWVDRCFLEPIAEGPDGHFAIVLLLKHKNKYLVQAKSEPGNNTPYRVVLTTTIQASYVNMAMNLSGEIFFKELYHHPQCKKFSIIQDGGQLLNKKSEVCFLEIEEKPELLPENFYWATLAEIKSFAMRGLVSEHIMQTLALLVFDSVNSFDHYEAEKTLPAENE